MKKQNFGKHAKELSKEVALAAAGAKNEANLRHEIEKSLESHCKSLDLPWVPFTFETALKTKKNKNTKFADVIHGAVVIEYEPPNCFNGKEGAKLRHAKDQAEEYAFLIHQEEGRELSEYIMVAWDGSHISFGKYDQGVPAWEKLAQFDATQAEKIFRYFSTDGTPLVHPQLLKSLVGPESTIGSEIIPELYKAVLSSCCAANGSTNKTNLF